MSDAQSDIGGPDILASIVSEVLGTRLLPGEFVAGLRLRRFTSLARLLHFRIATLHDPGLRDACLGALETLPEEAVGRLLRSPALCEILRGGGPGGELRRLLACELALSSGKAADGATGWSSLGDTWLGPEPPDPGLPLEVKDDILTSPSLDCGIPIDLSLPAFVGRPSAGLVNPRTLGRHEMLDAVALLDAAVAAIKATWPTGHAAFTGLTSAIVLRVDEGRPAEAWGASSGSVIGRTVIVNPAVAGGPPHPLADHLLHEVTHTALDCAELERPLIPDPATVADVVVPSPWTGNALTIHAFLHACAVWAVLLDYWSRCEAADHDCPVARKRRAFILRGFASVDANDRITPPRQALTEAASRLVATTATFARDHA